MPSCRFMHPLLEDSSNALLIHVDHLLQPVLGWNAHAASQLAEIVIGGTLLGICSSNGRKIVCWCKTRHRETRLIRQLQSVLLIVHFAHQWTHAKPEYQTDGRNQRRGIDECTCLPEYQFRYGR